MTFFIELQQFLIFFHFVPDVQPQGNYSEMFTYNALQKEGWHKMEKD